MAFTEFKCLEKNRLCKHNSRWVVTSMDAQMHTHFLANLQDLIPTLAAIIIGHKLAKVEIKSCRFARECVSFVHAWMSLYQAGIVFA